MSAAYQGMGDSFDLKPCSKVSLEEIRLWQESTPGDHSEWDTETVSDCDAFLTNVLNRVDVLVAEKLEFLEKQFTASKNSIAIISALEKRAEATEETIREACEYLDINDQTYIGHGSILHCRFQSIIKDKS
jgi:hypothetical protein